ncbi:binding-protein-dependent transport system inner membrane protein [Deinococcus grandis]|uniref:Binding-protein-dependent transport system inner membrane protein n=1 Tax=Deinococcus grandis TaxID=57498 RepID=A0A100HM53_9DEIO|nr:ABC transporter permease [Deinococcus grandis]BBN96765.1 peptide ABC transporter permease [Deinococcus grandis]GAQ23268.1 binding-protein-dependent transport system inner membrane protein [Deinococcus grandis]
MTALPAAPTRAPARLTPAQLALRRFRRSRAGVLSAWVLAALYLMALLSGFLAPYSITAQHEEYPYQRPQAVHVVHDGQLTRPFVYGFRKTRDPVTFASTFSEDRTRPIPILFLVRGDDPAESRHSLLGVFRSQWHLFGVRDGYYFPLGTDKFGRDLLSRMLVGSQVSLTVGLIGILISFTIGIVLGGVSGYFGGWVDNLIQRLVEVLLSFPRLPILLALSTIIPARWPSTWVYLGIVAVLALIGWAGLARVVRGQVMGARGLDYVQAARAIGAPDLRVILRHIMPNLSSFLIVTATLALPGYILGESALSFLGLGIKEPMTSWGLLLKDAQNFETLSQHPWLLLPGVLIVISVLAFNFVGDALRDAADTQSR